MEKFGKKKFEKSISTPPATFRIVYSVLYFLQFYSTSRKARTCNTGGKD